MKRLVIAALLAAGCAKPAAPPPGTAAYEAADRGFTCLGPSSWKVLERQGGGHEVSFYGPPAGPKPFSVSIAVYHYGPGTSFTTSQDYVAAQAALGRLAPAREREVAGRKAVELRLEKSVPRAHPLTGLEPAAVRAVLVPAGKGFYALVSTAPPGAEQDEVFELVLSSFKPAG